MIVCSKMILTRLHTSVWLLCLLSTWLPAQVCVPPPEGLIAWWPGDGNTDDIVGGRNGVFFGTPGFSPGMVEGAFRFDGNSFVEVADDPIWTLGNHPFTIDCWVNFSQVRGRDPFVAHDEGAGERNKFIFWYDASGHNKPRGPALRFHINSPTLPPLDPAYAPWTPQTDRWYHVAVTRDGSEYRLYIDGDLVSVDSDPNTIPDPRIGLHIGRGEFYRFIGMIDEVEIFDRALQGSEIRSIFDAGSAGKCKGGVQYVFVDVKPGSCPNPINPSSRGVLPVAILGTEELDVSNIDPESVRLQGVPPLRWAIEDVVAPFVPPTTDLGCLDCGTGGPDGFPDLILKFRAEDIVAALGDPQPEQCVPLQLTGRLREEFGGAEIRGEDRVLVRDSANIVTVPEDQGQH